MLLSIPIEAPIARDNKFPPSKMESLQIVSLLSEKKLV